MPVSGLMCLCRAHTSSSLLQTKCLNIFYVLCQSVELLYRSQKMMFCVSKEHEAKEKNGEKKRRIN